jgi:hypothetical protein
MTTWWAKRSGFERLGVALLGLLLLGASAVLVRSRTLHAQPLPCANADEHSWTEDQCIGGYSIISSYDALPIVNQKELLALQEKLPYFGKGFVGRVDGGQFRIAGSWPHRSSVIADIDTTATFDRLELWPTVHNFLRELEKPFNKEAKNKSSKINEPSCDPTNAWTLLKLHEEPLRRCLRTMFLLEMTHTFNDRTQKLFENQTIKYADGTKGPLSLTRKGNTDSDRSKVVAAVKAIDNKARALGGYH